MRKLDRRRTNGRRNARPELTAIAQPSDGKSDKARRRSRDVTAQQRAIRDLSAELRELRHRNERSR